MCLPVKPFKVEREWIHAGLKCAVTQNREGAFRCAYVRVPPTHPFHGKDNDDIDANIAVHGGLTFAKEEPCTEEDGKGWWFGFDFAHCGDAMHDPNPEWEKISMEAARQLRAYRRIHEDVLRDMQRTYPGYKGEPEHFWTQAEVEKECEQLAEQLAAVHA